jgi:hypothetical protein
MHIYIYIYIMYIIYYFFLDSSETKFSFKAVKSSVQSEILQIIGPAFNEVYEMFDCQKYLYDIYRSCF